MIVSCQNTGQTLDVFKTSNPAKEGSLILMPGMMASVSGTVQYSFPCGLRGFHVYKEIWKPKVGDVLSCIHERNNQHDRYAIAPTKLLPRRLGHLPHEISHFTRFLISRGADVFVTVNDAHFQRLPLIQGGLQIPVEATVRMEASTKNVEAIERFNTGKNPKFPRMIKLGFVLDFKISKLA